MPPVCSCSSAVIRAGVSKTLPSWVRIPAGALEDNMKSMINRDKLIEILVSNREKHVKLYEEAMEAYRLEAIKKLEKLVLQLKAGNTIDSFITILKPEDHSSDYDRVIQMLELDTRKDIPLEEHEFTQFVMDEWGWKHQWADTVSHYVGDVEA